MAELKTFPVYGLKGQQIGTLKAAARFLDDKSEKTVVLSDGREIRVQPESLEVRGDGTFHLKHEVSPQREPAAAQAAGPQVVAAIADAPAGITGSMLPRDALFLSGYDIQTVPVGRVLDGPAEERQEGDTIVLPVVEEVWVVEKRQFLREEIRITRKKQTLDRARTIDKNDLP